MKILKKFLTYELFVKKHHNMIKKNIFLKLIYSLM